MSASTSKVANRGLPAQAKCNVCKKTKPTAANFSSRQQDVLKTHMKRTPSFNPDRDSHAVCTSCTSQQVVELTCYYCDKTKGLDRFPNAQRKKPDMAECWRCQGERLNLEPGTDSDSSSSDSHGHNSDDDDDDDDYSLSSPSGGASLHTDMDSLSMSNGGRAATYATNTSTSGSTGGVALSRGFTPSTQSSRPSTSFASGTPSVASSSNRTINSSKFDPNAYGNPGRRAPASESANSFASGTPSVASSSNRTIISSKFNPNAYGNPGRRAPASESARSFAKVKAGPRKVVYDVAEQERAQEKGPKGDSDEEIVQPDSDED